VNQGKSGKGLPLPNAISRICDCTPQILAYVVFRPGLRLAGLDFDDKIKAVGDEGLED
jgi:hypothetical protein